MFYIDNKIVLFDEDKQKLQDTIAFMPQYADLPILETDRPIVDFEFADTPEYEQEQAEKERARLDALTLTPADVYKGLALAKNIMPEQLKALLPKYITDPMQLASCLVDLDYAKDFYRVHPLFNMTENISEIGITPTQWDKFFESKDYKDLLPIVEEPETEPEIEATTETEE